MVCLLLGLGIALTVLHQTEGICTNTLISDMPRPEVFDNSVFGIKSDEYLQQSSARNLHVIKDTLCSSDKIKGWMYIAENTNPFRVFVASDVTPNMVIQHSTGITPPGTGLQYKCHATAKTIDEDNSYYGILYPSGAAKPVVARVIAQTDDTSKYPCTEILTPGGTLTAGIKHESIMIAGDNPFDDDGGIYTDKEYSALTGTFTSADAVNLAIRPIIDEDFKYTCTCGSDADCNAADIYMVCAGNRCGCATGHEYDNTVHKCVNSDIAADQTANSDTTSTSLTDGDHTTCEKGKDWWVIDLGTTKDVFSVKLTAPVLEESYVTLIKDFDGSVPPTEEIFYGDSKDITSIISSGVNGIKTHGTSAWQIYEDTDYGSSTSIFNRDLMATAGPVSTTSIGAVVDVKSVRKVVSGKIEAGSSAPSGSGDDRCLHVNDAEFITVADCGSATVWYLDETDPAAGSGDYYITVLEGTYEDKAIEVQSVTVDDPAVPGSTNTAFALTVPAFIAGAELKSGTNWCLAYDGTSAKIIIKTDVSICTTFKWIPYPEDPHNCQYGELTSDPSNDVTIDYVPDFASSQNPPCLEVIDNSAAVGTFFTLDASPHAAVVDVDAYDASLSQVATAVQWKACDNGLNNFKISVGNVFTPKNTKPTGYTECDTYKGYVTWGATFDFPCIGAQLSGQYVLIESIDASAETLCEVKVTSIIDLCLPNPCANGACYQNAFDSYTCTCTPGFDGTNCDQEINECIPNPCVNGGCQDSTGINSYTCTCDPGYEGSKCDTDKNECSPNPCLNNGICSTPDFNSYTCACNSGWVGINCDKECTQDSDCNTNPEDQHKICNQVLFVCECMDGWRYHEDAKLCVDVDQCVEDDLNKCWCADAGSPGVINGTCVNHASSPLTNPNHAGTHECLCPDGYSHDDIKGCCRNIDETQQDNCGCEDGCTDKVPDVDGGSLFECKCSTLPGYEVGPDKLSCLDIDECDLNFSNSGKKNCKNSGSVFGDDATIIQGMCSNTAGSYICSCGAGYEVTTESNCKDIDECASNSTNECQDTCINTNGGYYCACDDSGYEIGVDGESCLDIDECKRGIHICDDGDDSDNGMTHAYCSNTQGSYMCICPDGYLDWNGDICVDINECDLTPTPCEDKCTNKNVDNSGMKYECSCEGYGQGYQLAADGHACQDIDECSEDDPCVAESPNDFESHIDSDEDGKCHNTHGGYTCECSKGYAAENGLNGFDFIKCINIDECDVANGGCDHKCIDGNGNRTCTCDKGYDLLDDEESCKDQDECDDEGDDCEQVCVNTVGSFTCDCDEGYKLNLDGNTCSNINECSIQNGGCMHTCVDEDPGYNCKCRDGYFLLSNLHECDDHDECVSGEDTCDRNNGYCVNQVARDPHPDGYSCECNQGYKMENDTCVDIDECEVKNGGCHHVCNNDVGTFTCSCRTGYDLADNKEDCDDKNECDAGTDTCDAMHGNCVNTMVSGQHPMGYYCTCNEGYELDGSDNSCDDVDECSTNNGGCTQNCADTDGSFTCSCNHGFTLGPDNRHCDDINECDDSNLCVGGVCVNDIGGYQCICDGEYTYPVEGKRVCFGDEWISIKFCRARPWDDKYDHMSHPDTMELKNEVETAYGNNMRQIPNVDSVTVTSFYEGNRNVCIIMAIKFDSPLQSSQVAVVSSAASDAIDSTSIEIDGEDTAASEPSEIVYTDPQTNAAASDQISAPCDYLNNIDFCPEKSSCVNPNDDSIVPFCLCDEGHTGSDCTPRGLGSDMIALIASMSVIGGLILVGAIIGLAYCCCKSNRPYGEYRDDESDKSYYRKDFPPVYYRNPQPAAVYGVYGYRS